MRGSGVMGLLCCRAWDRQRWGRRVRLPTAGSNQELAGESACPTNPGQRHNSGTCGQENSYTRKTCMFRFLPLVLKNCWRNRRRTLLTIASISVSMCLLGVMIAMYHALYLSDATPEQALRVVTRNKISLT